MNRKEYQEHCKHSPYSGQCYKKSFISGVANNVHVNMRCDGKCPRMRMTKRCTVTMKKVIL